MPFLVRKIMRSSNVNSMLDCTKENLLNISSDVTTNEFRTSDSKLSVWAIDSLEDLDKAALAISMGGQRIEDIKIVAIDASKLEDHFSLEKTPGDTVATSLINMHRDICGITHNSLTILLSVYKEAIDSSMCIRYKTKKLKELVKDALATKQIDVEAANDKLANQLRELQAS